MAPDYQGAPCPLRLSLPRVSARTAILRPMARTYGGRAAQAHRRLVAATYPWVCTLCGEPIASFDELEVEHLIPRALGGDPYDLDNSRPAHGTRSDSKCNQRRGTKPLNEYRATRAVDALPFFQRQAPSEAPRPVSVSSPTSKKAADRPGLAGIGSGRPVIV